MYICQKSKIDLQICPRGAEKLCCPSHIWALIGINPDSECYLAAVTRWLEKVYLKCRLVFDSQALESQNITIWKPQGLS